MKVLDPQSLETRMPEKVMKYFFYWADTICNGVYVEYTVGESSEDEEELTPLDKWLQKKCGLKEFEKILIKHWW